MWILYEESQYEVVLSSYKILSANFYWLLNKVISRIEGRIKLNKDVLYIYSLRFTCNLLVALFRSHHLNYNLLNVTQQEKI